jgi:hypothetical protein
MYEYAYVFIIIIIITINMPLICMLWLVPPSMYHIFSIIHTYTKYTIFIIYVFDVIFGCLVDPPPQSFLQSPLARRSSQHMTTSCSILMVLNPFIRQSIPIHPSKHELNNLSISFTHFNNPPLLCCHFDDIHTLSGYTWRSLSYSTFAH